MQAPGNYGYCKLTFSFMALKVKVGGGPGFKDGQVTFRVN